MRAKYEKALRLISINRDWLQYAIDCGDKEDAQDAVNELALSIADFIALEPEREREKP